jgi:hypothetical protein
MAGMQVFFTSDRSVLTYRVMEDRDGIKRLTERARAAG